MGVAAARRTLATTRLASVTDSLRSVPCRSLASGADSTLGVHVRWIVTPGAASQSVLASAVFTDHRIHLHTAESLLPCD